MKEPKKFKCKSCEMEFFNNPKKKSKKGEEEIICPYCGSKLWHDLIIE